MDDAEAMREAIACARTVEGRTSPRPPVGAVLVRNNVIVGKGATSPPYGPHAEIHALTEAGEAAAGADLYTTLEPCCVTIHTGPCTEAIIAAGVRRVIVGVLDPNPLVAGRGIEQLRAAGIIVDLLEVDDAKDLIRPFTTFITQKRPLLTAKWAMTLDGKIATHTGDAYWVSGLRSRLWVHNFRDRVDALLIGSGTARVDDPQLTVRLPVEFRVVERAPRQMPLRVILATNGQLPDHLHLLQPELVDRTYVFVGETCSRKQQQHLQGLGVSVIPVAVDKNGKVDLLAALQILAQLGCMHVLVEGGASIFGSAFDRQYIDRVAVFIAPKVIGGAMALSPVGGSGLASMAHSWDLQNVTMQSIGKDVLIEANVVYGQQEC